jgi:hypothetical protein
MWTVENRARYDRSELRHPSDLTNEEWALVKTQIPRATMPRAARISSTSRRLRLAVIQPYRVLDHLGRIAEAAKGVGRRHPG